MRVEDLDYEDDCDRAVVLHFVRNVLRQEVISGEIAGDESITVQHLVKAAKEVLFYGLLEPSSQERRQLQEAIYGECDTVEQQVRNGIIAASLEGVFGPEWIDLDDEAQAIVGDDYERASTEDQISPREYQQRIGRGNLESYAKTLKAQKRYRREKADGM